MSTAPLTEFIDLRRQYDRIQEDVESAVLRVLRGGSYIMGSEVAELESELARFVGVDHAISCASGTDALIMALMASGIGPGDAVFAPPFTFVATAEAIALVGAVPVFVDVDPRSYNIDPQALGRAIRALRDGNPDGHPLPRFDSDRLRTLKLRAIIPVDLFGLPADYEAIGGLAADHGLVVIQDAAQSFGAIRGNRRAGGHGDIGCTSFFPAKPLGCYGDGGALFTGDAERAAILRSIRVHGQGTHKYDNVRLGIAGRLDTVQAAVLLAKLKIFEDEFAQRQRVAAAYTQQIEASELPLQVPDIPEGTSSAWAQYSLLAPDPEYRDRLLAGLGERGVPTAIYYPRPLHLQPAFASLGYREGDFPVSEAAARRIFSLPMHPYLEDGTIAEIVSAMANAA
jgi:dTDP-4-amino-4,6-dideoxygalactose transaminase